MPVYFEPGSKPRFNAEGLALKIDRVEIVEQVTEQFAERLFGSGKEVKPTSGKRVFLERRIF
jgi:hypothetical protein